MTKYRLYIELACHICFKIGFDQSQHLRRHYHRTENISLPISRVKADYDIPTDCTVVDDKDNSDIIKYACPCCHELSDDKFNLGRHIEESHLKLNAYVSPEESGTEDNCNNGSDEDTGPEFNDDIQSNNLATSSADAPDFSSQNIGSSVSATSPTDIELENYKSNHNYKEDKHTLEATVIRRDNGNEIIITRTLHEPYICLCKKKYTTKNGFKTHIPRCPIVSDVEFEGIGDETAIPYYEAVKRATSQASITREEQKNNLRLTKVMKLQPIILKDTSREEYALLGTKDVADDMRQRKRMKLSTLEVEEQKKKAVAIGAHQYMTEDDVEGVIINGPYSDILDPLSYKELDADMACGLNMDWFMFDKFKYYCALLLAGAVMIDGKKGIMINTIEVYGRTPLTDPHHERFLNGKSANATTLPPATNLLYNDVCATVKREDSSRKLIIATKSMNGLVTSSIRIDQEVEPELGSSTMQFTPSLTTRIFVLKSQLDAAKKVLTVETVKYLYPQDLLSQLRQVRSKFTKAGGYMPLRASSPMTNYHTLKPYTIWTVYCFDDTSATPSAAKLGSKLFQLIARSNFDNKYVVTKSEVEALFNMCNAGKIKDFMKTILSKAFNDDGDDLVLRDNRTLEQCLQGISQELSSTIKSMNKSTADRILEVFKYKI